MNLFGKKTIVTHDLGFHADDVFSVAVLSLVFGKLHIKRTRDEKEISKADIVVDVGRVYDPKTFRFDHHQEGGAGNRGNGIPYASFGLVWKEFGEKLCASREEIEIVDKNLVQPVDAEDNGFSIFTPIVEGVAPFTLSGVIGTLNPTTLENQDYDSIFLQAVDLAKVILKREIISAQELVQTRTYFREVCKQRTDPRYVVLEREYSRTIWGQCVHEFPELLFVVVPRGDQFALRAIRKNSATFENRKDLPLLWAGKSGKELEDITGIVGVNFCHNKRFVATAFTKEAILKMLEVALKE